MILHGIVRTGEIVPSVLTGVLAGMFFGTFFGLSMDKFVAKRTKEFSAVKEQLSEELTIIYDGGANLYVGPEGVGGWLYLTDEALIFKPHKFNIQTEKARVLIPIHTISKIEGYESMGFIHNGLRITTYDIVYEFVVDERSTWIKLITLYAS